MTAGEAKVIFGADTKKLDKGFKQAESSTISRLSSISVAFGTFLGNVFSNVLSSAKNAANKAIDLFYDFGKSVIDAGDELQRLNIALEALLGSEEKAAKLTEDIAAFADKSPFETTQVENAAKSLLAFGFEMENIIELLEKAGSVSAIMGKDLESVAYAFGLVKSGAGGMAMRTLRLMGISTADLEAEGVRFTAGGQLESSADEMMAGIMKVIERRFGDGLEQFSQTFSGLISTLLSKWDSFKKAIASSGFLDTVNKTLTNILDQINSWGESGQLQEWAEQLSGYLDRVLFTALRIAEAITGIDFLSGMDTTTIEYDSSAIDETAAALDELYEKRRNAKNLLEAQTEGNSMVEYLGVLEEINAEISDLTVKRDKLFEGKEVSLIPNIADQLAELVTSIRTAFEEGGLEEAISGAIIKAFENEGVVDAAAEAGLKIGAAMWGGIWTTLEDRYPNLATILYYLFGGGFGAEGFSADAANNIVTAVENIYSGSGVMK